MELHRGRLIDHIQLVVADLDASRRFYEAVFNVFGVPVESNSPSHFWGDELFISTPDGPEAAGKLTGRPGHAAEELQRRRTARRSTSSTQRGWKPGARTMARPACAPNTIRTITPPSCSIPTETISRPSTTAKPSAAQPP